MSSNNVTKLAIYYNKNHKLGKEVYRGILTQDDEPIGEVAVKLINLIEHRFELWLNQTISQSGNRNILKMLAFEIRDNKLLLATELCDETLQNSIPNVNSELDAKEILIQIVKGYETLYDNYIVHRDIKPSNILVKKEMGDVIYKLADFGLSNIGVFMKSLDVGTINYRAPELAESKEVAIYILGRGLYLGMGLIKN